MFKKRESTYYQLPKKSRDYIDAYLILKKEINKANDRRLLGRLGELARIFCNRDSSDAFFDLSLWAGLKIDSPAIGQEYLRTLATEEQIIEQVYLRHRTRRHQSDAQVGQSKTTPQIKRRLVNQRARRIANVLVEIIGGCETEHKMVRLRHIQKQIVPWLSDKLTDEEKTAFGNVCQALLYPASFLAGWHTYNIWRSLVADLPSGLNARDRRSARSTIDRIEWPNAKTARAAQAIKKRLIYTR